MAKIKGINFMSLPLNKALYFDHSLKYRPLLVRIGRYEPISAPTATIPRYTGIGIITGNIPIFLIKYWPLQPIFDIGCNSRYGTGMDQYEQNLGGKMGKKMENERNDRKTKKRYPLCLLFPSFVFFFPFLFLLPLLLPSFSLFLSFFFLLSSSFPFFLSFFVFLSLLPFMSAQINETTK